MPRSRPPRDPPEFFVDRSLGYHMLPDALRALGFVVHTMRSVYGPDAEETVPDVVWLEQALAAHGVRAFCLTNANLTGEQQRDRSWQISTA